MIQKFTSVRIRFATFVLACLLLTPAFSQTTPGSHGGEFPFIMWGVYHPDLFEKEIGRLKDLGFTHCIMQGVDQQHIWNTQGADGAAPKETREALLKAMDIAARNDFHFILGVTPGRFLRKYPDLQRQDRRGRPILKTVNGNIPKAQDFCRLTGRMVAESYGDAAAFDGALIHTEVRDGTRLSFSKVDRDAYKAFSGQAIPATVHDRRGIRTPVATQTSAIPRNRVVPDGHPILQYYDWFWKEGDGWNRLHREVAAGLSGMKASRPNFWTFHDPAARNPSFWGNAKGLDVLSQWSYTERGPLYAGMATDEILAMARGSDQDAMSMVQSFWYRRSSAPKPGTKPPPYRPNDLFNDRDDTPTISKVLPANAPAWEREHIDANDITISPDHMRLALWTILSRPVKGMMIHGWQSLAPDQSGGYAYTNPETQIVVKSFSQRVLKPHGRELLQAEEELSKVAVLRSFTSEIFAQRGTYGWGKNWSADLYTAIQHAGYQPHIVFEEEIKTKGFGDTKVLFLPECDVLPQSVFDAIQRFQQRGGIVIGDDHLCPSVLPDITLQSFERSGDAEKAKSWLLYLSEIIRRDLRDLYTSPVQATNPEVITRVRTNGNAWYIFAINDHRKLGPYVGRHKLILEEGISSRTDLFFGRQGTATNMLTGAIIPTRIDANGIVITDLEIEAGSGILIRVQ